MRWFARGSASRSVVSLLGGSVIGCMIFLYGLFWAIEAWNSWIDSKRAAYLATKEWQLHCTIDGKVSFETPFAHFEPYRPIFRGGRYGAVGSGGYYVTDIGTYTTQPGELCMVYYRDTPNG